MPDAAGMWETIEQRELELPGVTSGTGFGRSAGLRIGGRIFAIRTETGLVVKLPKDRVDRLVASGAGRSWGPGGKRVMKEWVELPAASAADWPGLVAEARAYVGG